MRQKLESIRVAIGIVATWLLPSLASAVVVLPKGSNKPVMGYLVRQDERTVIIRQESLDGKSRELRFAPTEIDELIITVSPERLTALDPVSPALYFEYAEELSE